LTFDADGNLWITDFGGNFVAELAAEDLDGDGEATVVAESSIVLSVSALLNRPAFDDEGGLWISHSAGRVVRIAPADLQVSTGAGDPTAPDVVLSGEGIGNTANVAFFPAPAGLPLYHSLP
jgi:streptogramin lyase